MSEDKPYTTVEIKLEIDGKRYSTVHKFSAASKKTITEKQMILNAIEAFKKRIDKELS